MESVTDTDSFLLTHLLGDIIRGWELIAVGVLVSISTATLGLCCLQFRLLRRVFNICTFAACSLLTLGFVYFTYEESFRRKEHYCDDFGPVVMENCEAPETGTYLAYFTAAIAAIFLVLLMYQLPKLRRGHIPLRLGTIPFSDYTRLILIPLLGLLMNLLVLVGTLSSVLHLSSYAEIVETDDDLLPGGRRRELVFGLWQRPACLLILLVSVWWISMVAFWVEFMAASLCQSWYFAKDRAIQKPSICRAAKHALMHTGSLACAAVILPIYLIPRNFLTGMKSLVRRLSYNRAACYIKSCRFCLGIYDKSLKFKVEHCIAQQTLWGDSFEVSCRRAFYLVKRSDSQPRDLLSSSHFCIWLYELCVLLSAPLFTYYWLLHSSSTFSGAPTKFLTSGIWLALVTGACGWGVSSIVRGYLRGCVHGVLVAYLCEHEMFKGLLRGENYEISRLIEDFSAVSLTAIADEGVVHHGTFAFKSDIEKRRKRSRVAMLENQITYPTKGLDSEIDDDINNSALDATNPGLADELDTGVSPIPKPPVNISLRADRFTRSLRRTVEAEESVAVDDTRPFGSRGATQGDAREDDIGEVPDFAPVSVQSQSRPKQSLKQYLKRMRAPVQPEVLQPPKPRKTRLVRQL